MTVLGIMLVSAASGGPRTLLFVLVLVAVALIIAGAVIAAYTWYNLQKAKSAQINATLLESEHF